jgi:hypothetical protein
MPEISMHVLYRARDKRTGFTSEGVDDETYNEATYYSNDGGYWYRCCRLAEGHASDEDHRFESCFMYQDETCE